MSFEDGRFQELEEKKAAEARRLQEAQIAADTPGIDTQGRIPATAGGDVQPVLVNTHDIAYPEFGSATPSAPSLPADHDG